MAGLVELFSNQCVTNYGQTACGYHCIAAHGHVACARTSSGICGTTSRRWHLDEYGPDERLHLESVGVELAVDDLYIDRVGAIV